MRKSAHSMKCHLSIQVRNAGRNHRAPAFVEMTAPHVQAQDKGERVKGGDRKSRSHGATVKLADTGEREDGGRPKRSHGATVFHPKIVDPLCRRRDI
jgi:hypothetical protein